MIQNQRNFWLSLCLVNLCIVALLGFLLRSKILFPIPFLDYRNLLSAHSYFAFAGWAGLALIVLMIYDILPPEISQRKIYQWILIVAEFSSLGIAFLFHPLGHHVVTTFFSMLYMVAMLVFVPVFIGDVLRSLVNKNVRLLSISAVVSLIFSFLGVAGLAYVMIAKTGGVYLYRDSMYIFLHFQYNGFFTLAVFALFVHYTLKTGAISGKNIKLFSVFLCLSILPALFLSLLWHNDSSYYIYAGIGCLFILASLLCFFLMIKRIPLKQVFPTRIAKLLCIFSLVSFALKSIMQVGTIFPRLGNAVYGDRPVIIGFLHLAFLGIVTFFILAALTANNFFTKGNKIITFPLIVFSAGIFANELLLMLQGLGILLNTNNDIYKWLLWTAAILLLSGALMIALTRFSIIRNERKLKSHS